MITRRTCVAPPVAPHSNYFKNYNKFRSDEVLSMQASDDVAVMTPFDDAIA